MPTKTKPKPPFRNESYGAVTISEEHKILLLECLNVDPKSARAESVISALQNDLAVSVYSVHKGRALPLQPHIAAELEPVAKHAKELISLLSGLSPSASSELNVTYVDDGIAQKALERIALGAGVAITRLLNQENRGAHIKHDIQLHGFNAEAFRSYFAALRPRTPADDSAEYEGDREEFVTICQQYLPPPLTTRK